MIQPPTAAAAALAARRAAYVGRHRLKVFKLSGRSLMRLVRSRCCDQAVIDLIRKRFTLAGSYGTDLKMESRTFDHLEMFGHRGQLVALVAHPYHVTEAGLEDMALLH